MREIRTSGSTRGKEDEDKHCCVFWCSNLYPLFYSTGKNVLNLALGFFVDINSETCYIQR